MEARRLHLSRRTCHATRLFGDEVLFSAMLAVAVSAGDIRGFANPDVFRGLCMLFAAKPLSEAAVRAVFATIEMSRVVKEARQEPGFSLADDIKEVVVRQLARIASRGRVG